MFSISHYCLHPKSSIGESSIEHLGCNSEKLRTFSVQSKQQYNSACFDRQYFFYCRTLYFRCMLISRFYGLENSLHFNFAFFLVNVLRYRFKPFITLMCHRFFCVQFMWLNLSLHTSITEQLVSCSCTIPVCNCNCDCVKQQHFGIYQYHNNVVLDQLRFFLSFDRNS